MTKLELAEIYGESAAEDALTFVHKACDKYGVPYAGSVRDAYDVRRVLWGPVPPERLKRRHHPTGNWTWKAENEQIL